MDLMVEIEKHKAKLIGLGILTPDQFEGLILFSKAMAKLVKAEALPGMVAMEITRTLGECIQEHRYGKVDDTTRAVWKTLGKDTEA